MSWDLLLVLSRFPTRISHSEIDDTFMYSAVFLQFALQLNILRNEHFNPTKEVIKLLKIKEKLLKYLKNINHGLYLCLH